jgi:tetratricopeptide (TPR) repeat protein
MKCPDCNVELTRTGKFWRCPEHGVVRAPQPPGFPAADSRSRCVFISYAWKDALKFAKRLASDLRKRGGYEVWMDLQGIEHGGLWEVRIEQGIRAASVVVAVLTRHSVREQSVCRDEVVFAINEGKPVVPLRVDPDPKVKPPLLLARRNWIDFTHDYGQSLAALLRYLAGDQEALLPPLLPTVTGVVPLDFSLEIARFSAGFTGRKWLSREIDTWLANPKGRALVIHFCTQRNTRTLHPFEFVASLVGQLYTQLPGYAQAVEPRQPHVGRPLAADAFRELIVEPTRSMPAPVRPRLIIVDSLDEAASQHGETVVDVLVKQAIDLPAWLRIIATSRPEKPILRRIQRLSPFPLQAERPENLDDLSAYIRQRLADASLATRVGADAGAVARRLEELSDGNFLYATGALEALEDGTFTVADLGRLTPGLTDFYATTFAKRFPDVEVYERDYLPILRALSVACGPIPVPLLRRVVGGSSEAVNRRLADMEPYLRVVGQGDAAQYALFHNSLREWLTDSDAAGQYWCDPASGHSCMAGACWSEYEQAAGDVSSYMLRHVSTHLGAVGRWKNIAALLGDPQFIRARREAGLTREVIADVATAVHREMFTRALALALLEAYADMGDSDRQQLRGSLNECFGRYAQWPVPLRKTLEASRSLHVVFFLGDTYTMENRQDEALRVFSRIRGSARSPDPEVFCATQIRRAYVLEQQDRIAPALRVLGSLGLDRAEAEKRYGIYYWWALYILGIVLRHAGRFLEAHRVLTRVDECSQRPGLRVSALHQLGVLDLELGNLPAAEEKFQRCASMRGQEPYDHRRAYEHRRLGQVYAMTGRSDEALAAFQESIDISTRCANPRYTQLTEQDLRKFITAPARIAEERPAEAALQALAARFGIVKAHEGGIEDAFRALDGRGVSYLDVLDERTARRTGRVVRWDVAHSLGIWHGTVMVLVADCRGRIVLQRRGEQDSRGRWDISVSGHLAVGEPDCVGAVRETLEELGLALMPEQLQRVGRSLQFRKVGSPLVDGDGHENAFSYRYRTSRDNRERATLFVVCLEKGQEAGLSLRGTGATLAARWRPFEEAIEHARRSPRQFASAFKQILHPEIIRRIQAAIGMNARR